MEEAGKYGGGFQAYAVGESIPSVLPEKEG